LRGIILQFIEGNGASIPAIGLGTWELRGRLCARIVEQALRLGYRHLDTAQIYENEREVGEGLRASGVPRNDVFVTTKVWPSHFAPPDLERSTKESLRRLRLAEVDLLLLHWPSTRVPLGETIDALAAMKRAGFARHIGVSNFDAALTQEAARLCPAPLACNQVHYNPFVDQTAIIGACRALGIAVVAYSPIAKGAVENNAAIQAVARRHWRTPAQITLRWLVQQGVSAIPRTSRLERLSQNLSVFDFDLTEVEMAEISGLAAAVSVS
jgi:diketogulonate reductase-like aldo/keto reductase